jgi:transposase
LEDCRHLTRRLEADLLAGGGRVVRVPTRLMAEARKVGRERGKSDPIEARAVALAAMRHPELPVAELDGPVGEVELLSDHRRGLVMQRTRICCQVRWFLHELDPDLVIVSRGLRRQALVTELLADLDRFDGVVAPLARELLERCHDVNRQIAAMEHELRDLVRQLAPSLLSIPGCGVLSAALIVGETASVHRSGTMTPLPGSPATHPFRSGQDPAGARSGSTGAGTGQ